MQLILLFFYLFNIYILKYLYIFSIKIIKKNLTILNERCIKFNSWQSETFVLK